MMLQKQQQNQKIMKGKKKNSLHLLNLMMITIYTQNKDLTSPCDKALKLL